MAAVVGGLVVPTALLTKVVGLRGNSRLCTEGINAGTTHMNSVWRPWLVGLLFQQCHLPGLLLVRRTEGINAGTTHIISVWRPWLVGLFGNSTTYGLLLEERFTHEHRVNMPEPHT